MSAAANPDIITDGLVFKYDTGDGKSYNGEPTTNLLSSPTDMEGSGWSLGNTPSQITITGNQPDPFGQNNAILFEVASDGGFYPHIRQIDKITGTTSSHTISIWAKSKSGSTRLDLVCFRSSPWNTAFSKTVTLTSEWQRFELSGNPLDTTGHRVYFMCQNVQSGTATEVYMAYPQLEQKSHATPFVNGTRSATQGLLDRTGTSTIDISNASFDSNAQMTFDGTDDYVSVPSFQRFASDSDLTIEAFVNPSSLYAYSEILARGYNSAGYPNYSLRKGGGSLGWSFTVGDTSSNYSASDSDSINTNVWQHVVGVFNRSENLCKIYVNGVSKATSDATGMGSFENAADNLVIGKNVNSSSYGYFVGDIDTVRLYNKALTAKEVLQNYNATKSRFGL